MIIEIVQIAIGVYIASHMVAFTQWGWSRVGLWLALRRAKSQPPRTGEYLRRCDRVRRNQRCAYTAGHADKCSFTR